MASCSITERHTRARSVPPERFWISEASVALPEAATMILWNSASAAMKACVDSAASMSARQRSSDARSVSSSLVAAIAVATGSRIRRTWCNSSTVEPVMQVADEPHAGEEKLRLEARHVGAVAHAGLEDADQRQRAHGLAQRVAREPEALREVLLVRQLRPGREFARHDQVLDLGDRLVGERGHGVAPGAGVVASPRS